MILNPSSLFTRPTNGAVATAGPYLPKLFTKRAVKGSFVVEKLKPIIPETFLLFKFQRFVRAPDWLFPAGSFLFSE